MQLIADILSFRDNDDVLAEQFKQSEINWDHVVVIGSQHLMLPAIYCRLKAKRLLSLIPEDLSRYLEEITSINRGRNEVLLKEAQDISMLFTKEKIDHVFIKGIALLAGNNFEDIAERMIGDIDILIAHNQELRAFNILMREGYKPPNIIYKYQQINDRHLPRQVSPQKLGAVELHKEILLFRYTHFLNNRKGFTDIKKTSGILIPSIENNIKICILALQINDRGYFLKYLNFKTIYDILTLINKNKQITPTSLSSNKYIHSFLYLSSTLFTELSPNKILFYFKVQKIYFMLCLHFPGLRYLGNHIINFTIDNKNRVCLIFYNKFYREHILKNKILKTRNNN